MAGVAGSVAVATVSVSASVTAAAGSVLLGRFRAPDPRGFIPRDPEPITTVMPNVRSGFKQTTVIDRRAYSRHSRPRARKGSTMVMATALSEAVASKPLGAVEASAMYWGSSGTYVIVGGWSTRCTMLRTVFVRVRAPFPRSGPLSAPIAGCGSGVAGGFTMGAVVARRAVTRAVSLLLGVQACGLLRRTFLLLDSSAEALHARRRVRVPPSERVSQKADGPLGVVHRCILILRALASARRNRGWLSQAGGAIDARLGHGGGAVSALRVRQPRRGFVQAATMPEDILVVVVHGVDVDGGIQSLQHVLLDVSRAAAVATPRLPLGIVKVVGHPNGDVGSGLAVGRGVNGPPHACHGVVGGGDSGAGARLGQAVGAKLESRVPTCCKPFDGLAPRWRGRGAPLPQPTGAFVAPRPAACAENDRELAVSADECVP